MSLLSILLASLLGSVHCAAMCGGFSAVASDRQPRRFAGVSAYNVGRLTTYSLLGLLAGSISRSLDTVGGLAGVSRVSVFLVGGLLIVYGIARLLSGGREFAAGTKFHRALVALYPRLLRLLPGERPLLRAFGIGLLSTFLPCGWLYGFAAVAATTGDPFAAVFVMFIFWVGTLPVMVTFGAFAREILTRWGAQVPAISSALLIAAGFFSIASHLGFVGEHHRHPHPQIEELRVPEGGIPPASGTSH